MIKNNVRLQFNSISMNYQLLYIHYNLIKLLILKMLR